MASELITTEYGLIFSKLKSEKLAGLCVPKMGVQTGPFGSQLHKEDYVEVGTPIITVEHLGENRIRHTDTPYVSDHDKDRLSKYSLKEGDIVFSRVGSVDRRSLVRKAENGWLFSGRCLRVRVDKNKIDPSFLSYFFGYEGFKNYIKGIAVGATMPSINTKILSEIRIFYPPLEEQKAIAHILGSLDDKIELNRQMNETLEAMAQALFKSWFVDFDPVIDNALAAGNAIPEEWLERAEQRKTIEKKDHSDINTLFPDEFELTEGMGWIPRGWKVTSLSEVISEIIDHRGKTPKKLGGDWAKNGYPSISAKNIKGNKLVRPDTIRFVDKDIYHKWMKVPLDVGDVIMTSEAPLGELYYLNSKIDYLLSQRLYAIRADKINCTGSYLFYWFQTEFGSTEIQNRATGTTVFGIKQSELRKVLVLCPSSDVLKKFDMYSHSFLEKMDANDISSTELAKLRDTLLPKLMSGELRIADAAAMVEEA